MTKNSKAWHVGYTECEICGKPTKAKSRIHRNCKQTNKSTGDTKMTVVKEDPKLKIPKANLEHAVDMMLPLVAIHPEHTFNVRQATEIDKETGEVVYKDVKGFASQIKAEGGLLQAVIVRARKSEDVDGIVAYDLVVGFRRYRAMQMLAEKNQKFATIPVKVLPESTPDEAVYTINMVENIQREDLRPFEQADRYVFLQNTYGLSGGEMSRRFGANRNYVNALIRIVKCGHPEIVNLWRAGHPSATTDALSKKIIKTSETTHEEQMENWLKHIGKEPEDEMDPDSEGSNGEHGAKTSNADEPKRPGKRHLERAIAAAKKLDDENPDAYFEGVIAALSFTLGDTDELARVYNPVKFAESAKAAKQVEKDAKKAAAAAQAN